ncbi:MAG: beta-propeller fold lactonase family protein [Alphaproteobacteria bacterium]|nr:beta-propeller fold lactonase family protein [Alphaproteobacteria bacterium]
MYRHIVRLLIYTILLSLPATGAWAAGAVYAMTNSLNSAGGNQILVFSRAANGALSLMQTVATGGGGSGLQISNVDVLGSQSSLVLDALHHRLFAVNTETLASNSSDCQQGTITSFNVATDGTLTIADRIASGGMYPNSLTVASTAAGEVLYALNAGGPGSPACSQPHLTGVPNITGFLVDAAGKMTTLPDSVQAINPGALNGTGSGENCPLFGTAPQSPTLNCGLNPPAFVRSAAQVRFSPDATQLLVTVKATNSIYVFPVDANGNAGVPVVTQAPGPGLPTYFGVTFDKNNNLLVTETFGKATSIPAGGAGAVSSFKVSATGTLTPISTSVGTGGTATCWVALEPTTGKYAYVSNNLSNAISSFSVGSDGSLKLLNANAAPAPTNGPNDLVVVGQDSTSSYLYVLNAGDGTVGAFKINLADGSLTSIGNVSGLPVNVSAQGLTGFSAPFPTPLVAAVLPASRSVQVGNTATAFGTVMNAGNTDAFACSIAPNGNLPVTFNYQTTNSSTNAVTGTPNTAMNVPAGGSQSFVIGLTPTAAITPAQVSLNFSCANQLSASVLPGVDTLLLSASATPVPDIVALAATMQNDGILHIPGNLGAGAFAVATINLGASTMITATANTGSATLPLALTICATDQNGNCLAAPTSLTSAASSTGSTPTFAIFGRATGSIPFNPGGSRVFVQFTDPNGVIRGLTSVAVATQ